MTIDEEFDPGSQEITQCITKRKKVKVVYQINQLCRDSSCTKPYAIGNINNAIDDYEITHGMKRGKDYEIVAIVHSGGALLVINNDAETPYTESNPFQADMEDLISKGVKVFFYQNTARAKGMVTALIGSLLTLLLFFFRNGIICKE
ncbi:MAG: DsrE family protein [bacterium]